MFIEGTILATTRTQYTADEPDEVVQKKMQTQHKTMLKRLRDGDFDHLPDLPSRSHPPKAEDSAEATPSAVASDPAQSTLRMALPPELKQEAAAAPAPAPAAADSEAAARAAAGELGRPSGPLLGPILAPVGPPPIPPRSAPATGSLADRLRRTPNAALGGGAAAAPPDSSPALPQQPAAAVRMSGTHPVLEFEAELPEDEDLEPAVTIEAEPAGSDTDDSDPTIRTAAGAPGTLSSPVANVITPPISPTAAMPIIAPRVPVPAPVPAPAPAPIAAIPPSSARPFLPTGLRSKPTAEGVVLQRTLVPTPIVRPGVDSVRTTSPRARPTAPAPLAVAQPAHPLDDDRSLDPVVLAYLAREPRPRS